MATDIPLNGLKLVDPKTLKGVEGIYINPATSPVKHTTRDFNGHYYRQPNAALESKLARTPTNASILIAKIFNVTIEAGKMSVFPDPEGGLCGMCQGNKTVAIPLNGSGTVDGGKGQIQVESVVDAANNIAVAIKDANGSNPMVLLYQIRESLNLLELVVLLPGQDPMAFSYEKPNFF